MDIIKLVTTEPENFKAYHLVKTRKDFVSNWYITLNNTDFSMCGDNNLLNRLVSTPKEVKYSQEIPDIPMFLPIVEQFLYVPADKNTDIYIETKYSSKEKLRKEMFKNFIIFLDKKGVNFLDYDDNNNLVLGKLISRIITWDRKTFSDWMQEGGLIHNKFNTLDLEGKVKTLEYIKNEWHIIWSKSLEQDLKEHFIYSGFSDSHTLFSTFECLFKAFEQEALPKQLFDDKLHSILNRLSEFSNYSKCIAYFFRII